MAIKSKDVTIDDVKFNITQYNAREGLKIKIKLLKMLAPVKDTVKKDEGKQLLDSEVDFVAIIGVLIENLDSDKTLDFILRMLRPVKVNGLDMFDELFDQTFAGNYSILYKLLMEIVEFNRFFGKGSILGMFKKETNAEILPKTTLSVNTTNISKNP